MRKIKALYINEMLKYSKKISVLVILAIMTVGVIGYGLVIWLSQSAFTSITGSGITESDRDMIESTRSYNNEEITRIEIQLESVTDPGEKSSLLQQMAGLELENEMLQLALENEIPVYTNLDFRSQLLQEYMQVRYDMYWFESIPAEQLTAQQKQQLADDAATVEQLLQAVKLKDFRAYIDLHIASIQADASLTDAEKAIRIESSELWYQADPTGGLGGKSDQSAIQSAIQQIETYKISLAANLDYSYASGDGLLYPLTPAARASMTDNLAALTYRLENSLDVSYYSQLNAGDMAVRGMFGFGLFMIAVMMLVLAGGVFSQEIATGSIKSLIISPARRWKIFTAKALSLLTLGLGAVLFLYIIAMLVRGVLFGFDGSPYVFAVNGNAGSLNYQLFMLGYILADFIDIIVYMALAMMLSIVTRNTALSVGLTIGIYLIGSFVSQMLAVASMIGLSNEWIKFIPFSNLSLAADFFPFDTYLNIFSGFSGMQTGSNGPSALFSLVYVVVAVFCMGFTALDSFVRRDIK